MLLGPSLHDDFLVRIELNRVTTLAVKISEEAVLPSAEREVCHRGGDSNVDPDISRRRFVPKPPCSRSARRKQRRLITVSAAFEERQSFVHAIGVNQAQHRTEGYGIGKNPGRRD